MLTIKEIYIFYYNNFLSYLTKINKLYVNIKYIFTVNKNIISSIFINKKLQGNLKVYNINSLTKHSRYRC